MPVYSFHGFFCSVLAVICRVWNGDITDSFILPASGLSTVTVLAKSLENETGKSVTERDRDSWPAAELTV